MTLLVEKNTRLSTNRHAVIKYQKVANYFIRIAIGIQLEYNWNKSFLNCPSVVWMVVMVVVMMVVMVVCHFVALPALMKSKH